MVSVMRIDAAKGNLAQQVEFLEEMLDGQEWRVAVAYAATPASLGQRMQDQEYYARKGYVVRPREEQGTPLLEIHRLGIGTTPLGLWQEMGFAKGTQRMLKNPMIPLHSVGEWGGRAVHWVDRSLHDPAQANGVINLAAESFLFFAGSGTKEGTMRDRKNWLQSLSALFFFAQSAVYALLAKTNDEVAIDHLKYKFGRMARAGQDVTAIGFDAATDTERPSLMHSVMKFIRRYPVQIGAIFNDMGMLAYIGHVRANRAWNRNILADPASSEKRRADALKYVGKGFNGYWKDITAAYTSIVAWALLLLPRKPRDANTIARHKDNVFATAWDKFREDPEAVSGAMTLFSSSSRLWAAAGDKHNKIQAVGEGIYILGDVAQMFIKNDAYGKETSKNIEVLAEKVAAFLNTQPYVCARAERERYVTHVSEYLRQKSLEEVGGDISKLHLTPAELNERIARLTQMTLKKIGAHDRFDALAAQVLEVVCQFVPAQRSAVQEAMVQTLSQLPWIKASPAEINAAIAKVPKALQTFEKPHDTPTQMRDLSASLGELLSIVKGIDAGGSAIALYRTLQPFVNQPVASQTIMPRPTIQAATVQASAASPILEPAR